MERVPLIAAYDSPFQGVDDRFVRAQGNSTFDHKGKAGRRTDLNSTRRSNYRKRH
jgi:hypothetical protein